MSTPDSLPKMTYHRLGSSGLKISRVVLGAMGYGSPTMSGDWVHDADAALPVIKHAYERGINTWDTADFYSQGQSEEILGRAIKELGIRRETVVIMTKCFFGIGDEVIGENGRTVPAVAMVNDGAMVNRVGLSRKHIFDAVDKSVERLGTYIDVLQIHRLDRDTPPEEIMRALNDVIESGKVRYIGASSMYTWEFQNLNNIASQHGWHKFISMQNYHNLVYREEEREMLPYCAHAGIGVVPWSPLAQGVLARPWNSDSTSRVKTDAYAGLLTSDEDKAIVDRVEEVAKAKGVSMAQVAVSWSFKKGVYPILGLQSVKRIDEAVGALGVELSDEEVKSLEEPYRARPVLPLW